jgi:hypothetical protein
MPLQQHLGQLPSPPFLVQMQVLVLVLVLVLELVQVLVLVQVQVLVLVLVERQWHLLAVLLLWWEQKY